jgi:hypothetical protein
MPIERMYLEWNADIINTLYVTLFSRLGLNDCQSSVEKSISSF